MPEKGEFLTGIHSVREALRAGRRKIYEVSLAPNGRSEVEEIRVLCTKRGIRTTTISRREMDGLSQGTLHNGVLARASAFPLEDVDALVRAGTRQSPAFLLALDTIQDPHNIGAILRTAEAVGVHGVILPRDRTGTITPTVSRVSAGAAEHMHISQVTNLARTLQELKQHGLWIVGIEQHPSAQDLWSADLSMPLVLVIGSEGKGMRRLTRETCDFLAEIPITGHVGSLNASVAASLALYATWKAQRAHTEGAVPHPKI